VAPQPSAAAPAFSEPSTVVAVSANPQVTYGAQPGSQGVIDVAPMLAMQVQVTANDNPMEMPAVNFSANTGGMVSPALNPQAGGTANHPNGSVIQGDPANDNPDNVDTPATPGHPAGGSVMQYDRINGYQSAENGKAFAVISEEDGGTTMMYDPANDSDDSAQLFGGYGNPATKAPAAKDDDKKKARVQSNRTKIRDRLERIGRLWNAMRARGQMSSRINARPDNNG